MTLTEYRDLLIETSAKGGFPAFDRKETKCSYLTSDGKKCAIGLLLPQWVAEQCDSWWSKGIDCVWELASPYMPDGMGVGTAASLQVLHDSMRYGWDHNQFVLRVNEIFRERGVLVPSGTNVTAQSATG